MVSFVFSHGNGMNKGGWRAYVDYLFQDCFPFSTHCIVALDAVNHADLAMANKGKLGIGMSWKDSASDLLCVVANEYEDLYLQCDRLIAVGHLYGGFYSLWAASVSPGVFDLIVAIDPIIYDLVTRTPPRPEYDDEYRRKIYWAWRRNLHDTFETEEEARKFYFEKSFWKGSQKRFIEDLFKDDYYVEEVNGKKVHKLKTKAEQQMATYMYYKLGPRELEELVRTLKNPCHFIIGGSSVMFQHKEFMKKIVPLKLRNFQMSYLIIPKASHIVHGEKIEEVSKLIADFVTGRCEGDSTSIYSLRKERFKQWQLKVKDQQLTSEEREAIFNKWVEELRDGNCGRDQFVPKAKL